MRRDDRVRLQHMLDSARDAQSFAKGRTREELETDRLLVLGLVKAIEIIGEAASRTSTGTRHTVSQLPWEDIVCMRHRLVHAYFDINLDMLWRTVQDDLPLLIEPLQKALEESESLGCG
jgi:uncharacterized protein with HEPN domain